MQYADLHEALENEINRRCISYNEMLFIVEYGDQTACGLADDLDEWQAAVDYLTKRVDEYATR